MGNREQKRAKRTTKVDWAAQRDALYEALFELLAVETFEDYVAVLERCPELGAAAARDEINLASGAPGYGPLIARGAVLLKGAQGGDALGAWNAYRAASEAIQPKVDALEAMQVDIDGAREAGGHARVLEIIAVALPLAIEIGFGATVSELLHQRGRALYNVGTVDRADELDGAIEAFQAALDLADPGEHTASILMHLGLAFGERIHGDSADNAEHSTGALRAALAELEGLDEDELRAMVLTNLSVALMRVERENRSEVAREAAALCRDALLFRSVDRDPDSWAYSQLNLAEALLELAEVGEIDSAKARSAFQEVIDHAPDIHSPMLVGAAYHALGRMDLAAIHLSPEDLLDAHAAGTLGKPPDNGPVLRAARAQLEVARDIITTDPIRRALVLHDLSRVLAELDEQVEAIDAAREALTILRPTTSPAACRDTAWTLGSLLAEREEWPEAAQVMRDAVDAVELMFHARLDTSSRELEARRAGNLHRWAAYAIARAGDPVGAAVVLEAGRAREVGRRLGDDTSLAGVPTQLRGDYLSAVRALAITPLGSDSTGSSRHLQEVIAAIRRLPGHDRFGARPRLDELAGALEPAWPLVYVDPAPSGTLLLVLWPNGDGEDPAVKATFLETTSNDVTLRLMAGDAADPHVPVDDGASYLACIGTYDEPEQFAAALDQLLPWLGETIAQPIAKVLESRAATGATLVVCGPLGLAPLHAATWESKDGSRCLLDGFDIRFAPSAVVCAAALRRVKQTRPARLVALADPQGDLPAARGEVNEISGLFGAANADVAMGAGADAKFLREHAALATHLHLACHARSGLLGETEAAVAFASGELPATELTAVAQLDARLVVVSACESALSQLDGLPGEVVSIGAVMLAAGSACAIASLWPVDDLATALLMTRLYQEMLDSGHRPPEALRRAQLWLRDLSEEDEQRFLDRHPALAAEFERRTRSGPGVPGRRPDSVAGIGSSSVRPYAHPDYWAPFIALGV